MAEETQRPPRMPEAVARKRPAQVIAAPPPGVVTGPLPTPPSQAGRRQRRPVQPGRPRRPRRRTLGAGWIALVMFFIGLFAVGMGLGVATGFDIGMFRDPDQPPPRAFPVLEPSRPRRLTIPDLHVDAPVLEVGRAGDGSVDVPPLKRHNEVGWFGGGPTPGQFGPALFVGHADTRTGPSVFHDLMRLRPRQRIEVLREDGTVAVFEVNSVEHYDKDRLPVHRVYGDYSRPSLRLMTCGGKWLGGDQGYADNVVVYASLIEAEQ
ncbi:class F sortase [Actinoplanes oblitus]|uniref:Class F sortase n=1 Tax=Actinoplanes oblitus TaxID=3040509 RepID=A0ABY8WIX1_9ACTN|nr:class F sortase [Actinoplanes oblitus]WIM97613.1 class F sortase [Actinoplanes oblitus]